MIALTMKWKNIMNLRELLGCCKPEPKMDEHEMMARRMIRQLTLMGFGSYEVWEITRHMEEYSLNSIAHPDLFPPNQRPVKIQPSTQV